MFTGHFPWLRFYKEVEQILIQRNQTSCTLLQTHQPAPDPGQHRMDSLGVPCAPLFGDADVDQAPVLPGRVDKSATVFRMDCLLVGLLWKGQRTGATQKPFHHKKSPNGASITLTPT